MGSEESFSKGGFFEEFEVNEDFDFPNVESKKLYHVERALKEEEKKSAVSLIKQRR